MRLGIHLPHIGRKAGPASIRAAAEQAEDLGFADVWVGEHIAVPKDAPYPPSKIFYEPLLTLAWAATCTRRIGLGTSVLVLPMRHPLPLAKELGTLQCLSEGRLILGAGVGWLEGEFAALGMPFRDRGRRMDECIALMRALWTQDPTSFETTLVEADVRDIRMLPQPSAPIPIWIGGRSEPALRRAVRLGDGWHGSQLMPADSAPVVARLRAERPAPFVLSMRTSWDGKDDGALAARLQAFADQGMDHVMVEPWSREIDDWLATVARVARAGGL